MGYFKQLVSRPCICTFLAIALLFGLSIPAAAQQSQLSGTVADPTGAVIPNATITIINIDTGAQREDRADSEGRYGFLQVAPGKYKLTAKAAGFTDVVINVVELQVASSATIPIVFEKVGAELGVQFIIEAKTGAAGVHRRGCPDFQATVLTISGIVNGRVNIEHVR